MRVSETDGKPIRPLLKTLNVNLTGAIYSELDPHPRCLSSLESSSFVPVVATQLAMHYLPKTRNQASPLKYVVFLGFLGMVVRTRPVIALLTMTSAESVVECACGTRDLRHLSARAARLREIGAAGSHHQGDPHRDGPIYIFAR